MQQYCHFSYFHTFNPKTEQWIYSKAKCYIYILKEQQLKSLLTRFTSDIGPTLVIAYIIAHELINSQNIFFLKREYFTNNFPKTKTNKYSC